MLRPGWFERQFKKVESPVWLACSHEDRLTDCRIMLALHGMITEAENKLIQKRISKGAKNDARKTS